MTILVQQQLRELAQAAPLKDWRAGNYYGKPFIANIEVLADTPEGLMVVMQGNQNFLAQSVAAVAFVGAASPAAVLALLDQVEQLEKSLKLVQSHAHTAYTRGRQAGIADQERTAHEAIAAMDLARDQMMDENERFTDLLEKAEQERDQLKAENARWQQNYEHLIEQHMPRTGHGCEEGWSRVVEARELQQVVERLTAENDDLRKRAEAAFEAGKATSRRPIAIIQRSGNSWNVFEQRYNDGRTERNDRFIRGGFVTSVDATSWARSNGYEVEA